MFVAGSSLRGAELSTLHRNIHYRASSCVLVTVCVICVCVMVVCGVVIAREYALSSEYEPATCRLRRVNYTAGMGEECTYCSGDKAKGKDKGSAACITTHFPCLQLDVTYAPSLVLTPGGGESQGGGGGGGGKEGGGEIGSPLLHQQTTGLRDALMHVDSLQANGPHSKCSYAVCHRTYEQNSRDVDNYAAPWRQMLAAGATFQCFYNTHDSGRVIAVKKYSRSDVIHGMLWPAVVIATCGVIFFRLETVRRGYTCYGRAMTSSGDVTNGRGERAGGGGNLAPAGVKVKESSRSGSFDKPWKASSKNNLTSSSVSITVDGAVPHHAPYSSSNTRNNNNSHRPTNKSSSGAAANSRNGHHNHNQQKQQQQQQQQLVPSSACSNNRLAAAAAVATGEAAEAEQLLSHSHDINNGGEDGGGESGAKVTKDVSPRPLLKPANRQLHQLPPSSAIANSNSSSYNNSSNSNCV